MFQFHVRAHLFAPLVFAKHCVQDKSLNYVLNQKLSQIGTEEEKPPYAIIVSNHHYETSRYEDF